MRIWKKRAVRSRWCRISSPSGSAATTIRSCSARSSFCSDRLQRLGELRTYAQALFSDRAHLSWGRAPLSGMEYLRLQLLKTLNALSARLLTIEAARSHHAAAESRPALRADRALSA